MVDIRKYRRGVAIIDFVSDEISRGESDDGFYSCRTFHTSGCETCPMKINGNVGGSSTSQKCALILLSDTIRFIKMKIPTVVLS